MLEKLKEELVRLLVEFARFGAVAAGKSVGGYGTIFEAVPRWVI